MAVDAAGARSGRARRSRWTSRLRRRSRARSRAPASSATTSSSRSGFRKSACSTRTGKWNCHQFHVGTEFFADFGVYDVRMTVPRGWPLAATGRQRERTDNADGTTTHRYYQEDVHDFAWTTSPDFLEARERFEHPGLPPVDMRLMLQPEHASQAARHFDSARATLRHYGEWFGAYPYGHLTHRRPPVAELRPTAWSIPTLFTVGTRWLMPREDTVPRRHRRARGRSPVVVRHGRHERVRGRLDGRRHQPVRERARRWPKNSRTAARCCASSAGSCRGCSTTCAWDRAGVRRVPARLPQQSDRRHPGDAVVPVLAADVRRP